MKSGISEIRWIDLPAVTDDRGTLTAIEAARDIPFVIERIFYMHHVSSGRGGHAHRDTDQVVIGISGRHVVEVKDAHQSLRFVLDDPNRGLYLPRMTFTSLVEFSPGAVSLVLASTHYDRAKSLRTFDDYLAVLEGSSA
jgi:hypothetical protein